MARACRTSTAARSSTGPRRSASRSSRRRTTGGVMMTWSPVSFPAAREAWNASHSDASSVAGSATAPTGGSSSRRRPSRPCSRHLRRAGCWRARRGRAWSGRRPCKLTVPAALCGCDVLAVAETGSKDSGVRLAPVGPRRRAGGVARVGTRGFGRGPDARDQSGNELELDLRVDAST